MSFVLNVPKKPSNPDRSPTQGWYSYAETNGYGMCEPNSGYKTLAERGSNRVVAM